MTQQNDIELVRSVFRTIIPLLRDADLEHRAEDCINAESAFDHILERTLPELPEGWFIIKMCYHHSMWGMVDHYETTIQKEVKPIGKYESRKYLNIECSGLTPRAAVLSALEKLEETK